MRMQRWQTLHGRGFSRGVRRWKDKDNTEVMWLVLDAPSPDSFGGIIQNHIQANTWQTSYNPSKCTIHTTRAVQKSRKDIIVGLKVSPLCWYQWTHTRGVFTCRVPTFDSQIKVRNNWWRWLFLQSHLFCEAYDTRGGSSSYSGKAEKGISSRRQVHEENKYFLEDEITINSPPLLGSPSNGGGSTRRKGNITRKKITSPSTTRFEEDRDQGTTSRSKQIKPPER